ncbi:MAG TPA: hypothetical protein VNZ26_17120 [Vicinamibacterales bacterium]|jgi:hypothetical protein|nr:hypothetical protein [Vicinamibacterales bacterium]
MTPSISTLWLRRSCPSVVGLALGAVVIVNLAAQSGAAQATQSSASATDIHGTWTAELRNGRVFLQIRTSPPSDWNRGDGDWNMGQTFSLDELEGIPAKSTDAEQFTVSSVKFDLKREAGSFAFEGAFREGRGAGLFTFTPRAAYVGEMKALGYSDDLPLWRRFQLAVHDVGPKYIRALRAEGPSLYSKLSLDQVQRAKNHGVTIDYIRELRAQGLRDLPIEDLVRARDHGVTGDYINTLKSAGYANLQLDQLVRVRDHGITPVYLDGMRRAGFNNLPLEDVVRAKDHGVNPDFVQEIRGLGLNVANLEAYVRLRDHGVKATFVNELKAAGYSGLSADELVRLHDHGVTADYIADLKGAGLKDLTLEQLVRLHDHGITPGFINHAHARGFNTVDAEELVRLRNGGLEPRPSRE